LVEDAVNVTGVPLPNIGKDPTLLQAVKITARTNVRMPAFNKYFISFFLVDELTVT
jgi:hypothetical protein